MASSLVVVCSFYLHIIAFPCVSFCSTTKWISYSNRYIPSPLRFPLTPCSIPLLYVITEHQRTQKLYSCRKQALPQTILWSNRDHPTCGLGLWSLHIHLKTSLHYVVIRRHHTFCLLKGMCWAVGFSTGLDRPQSLSVSRSVTPTSGIMPHLTFPPGTTCLHWHFSCWSLRCFQ